MKGSKLNVSNMFTSWIGYTVNWLYLRMSMDNSLSGSKPNIEAHYDLSNKLFETFLDNDTMMWVGKEGQEHCVCLGGVLRVLAHCVCLGGVLRVLAHCVSWGGALFVLWHCVSWGTMCVWGGGGWKRAACAGVVRLLLRGLAPDPPP